MYALLSTDKEKACTGEEKQRKHERVSIKFLSILRLQPSIELGGVMLAFVVLLTLRMSRVDRLQDDSADVRIPSSLPGKCAKGSWQVCVGERWQGKECTREMRNTIP